MDKSFSEVIAIYKTWVRNNPNLVTDLETVITWSSYFVVGKVDKSPLFSELVYCLSKLLSLHHDQLLREAQDKGVGIQQKIKLGLTIIHYTEVFIELAARRQYGLKGKWSIATILQVTKCVANLILLYKFKELPILHPQIPVLQRKKNTSTSEEDPCSESIFKLKRSGRSIRTVDRSPPLAFRDWQPVKCKEYSTKSDKIKILLYAETIHIIKPVVHLIAMKLFGSNAWKQWLLALGLDLSSLNLYKKCFGDLTYDQKVEISRRKLSLILYLLKSPIYNLYSRKVIENVLVSMSRKMPITNIICGPILQYMSHWQDIYFYMWST